MRRQVVRAIGDNHVVAALQRHQGARQLGGAVFIMMPKRFAVGRYHQRGAGLQLERGVGNPVRQPRAVGQSVAERDGGGQFAVEAENRQAQIAPAP